MSPGTLDEQRRALSRILRHDLRNPLTALAGYADLTLRAGDLNPGQTRWLGRLRQLVDKLSEAADDLSDVAWLDAGLPLDYVPFDLGVAIYAAVAVCAEEAQGREIALETDVAADLPALRGDPAWMERALVALVENGLRYSPAGATVRVRAWSEKGGVWCAVTDEGFGITPDDQRHVWDRYWRSPDPHVQAVPGGGLGLTLVRAVVLRQGGSLHLDSDPAQGTTVTIRFSTGESTS